MNCEIASSASSGLAMTELQCEIASPFAYKLFAMTGFAGEIASSARSGLAMTEIKDSQSHG